MSSESKKHNSPQSQFEDFLTYRGLWDHPAWILDLLKEAYFDGRSDEKQLQSTSESGSLFSDMGLQEVKLPSIMTRSSD